jgi:IS5 family transposase
MFTFRKIAKAEQLEFVEDYKVIIIWASPKTQSAIEAIDKLASISNGLLALRLDLNQYCQLAARVVDQTQRRVLLGENVPASDKVVSLFETHTDIIVKDRRDTFF